MCGCVSKADHARIHQLSSTIQILVELFNWIPSSSSSSLPLHLFIVGIVLFDYLIMHSITFFPFQILQLPPPSLSLSLSLLISHDLNNSMRSKRFEKWINKWTISINSQNFGNFLIRRQSSDRTDQLKRKWKQNHDGADVSDCGINCKLKGIESLWPGRWNRASWLYCNENNWSRLAGSGLGLTAWNQADKVHLNQVNAGIVMEDSGDAGVVLQTSYEPNRYKLNRDAGTVLKRRRISS